MRPKKPASSLEQDNAKAAEPVRQGKACCHTGIVLNYCQYGVLYLGSYYTTGPYIYFPHFGNSNLGKLPYVSRARWRNLLRTLDGSIELTEPMRVEPLLAMLISAITKFLWDL